MMQSNVWSIEIKDAENKPIDLENSDEVKNSYENVVVQVKKKADIRNHDTKSLINISETISGATLGQQKFDYTSKVAPKPPQIN